jgi:hypothetical protein
VTDASTLELIELDVNLDEPVECQYFAHVEDYPECPEPAAWSCISTPCGHVFSTCDTHRRSVEAKFKFLHDQWNTTIVCLIGEHPKHEVEEVKWEKL